MYYNLSKILHKVDKKELNRFQHTKLKNKSAICIGNDVYFFIFSKQLLYNYIKSRLAVLSAKKNKQNGILDNNKYVETLDSNDLKLNCSNNKIIKKKKSSRTRDDDYSKDENYEIKMPKNYKSNISSKLDIIIKPPGRSSQPIREKDNILDDIIEAPSKKTKEK